MRLDSLGDASSDPGLGPALQDLCDQLLGPVVLARVEGSARRMLSAIEGATGTSFSEDEITGFVHGADEIDLVNSGLEETMIKAYHEIREIRERHEGIDLRTASMVSAINKIATVYKHRGIFP